MRETPPGRLFDVFQLGRDCEEAGADGRGVRKVESRERASRWLGVVGSAGQLVGWEELKSVVGSAIRVVPSA